MSEGAVPVAVHGITWTGALVGLLNVLVGGALVAFIKKWPDIKRLANERESNLLNERAEEMATMRDRLAAMEARLEQKDALHAAERAVDRHRINNLSQCLTAFLMMVKKNPDDAAGIAVVIEEMRAEQIARETAEASEIHKAVIVATSTKASE